MLPESSSTSNPPSPANQQNGLLQQPICSYQQVPNTLSQQQNMQQLPMQMFQQQQLQQQQQQQFPISMENVMSMFKMFSPMLQQMQQFQQYQQHPIQSTQSQASPASVNLPPHNIYNTTNEPSTSNHQQE